MYFDDTTTSLTITLTNFDEDKTLFLNGKERLRFFADSFRAEPVHSPLANKRLALLNKMKRLLKK